MKMNDFINRLKERDWKSPIVSVTIATAILVVIFSIINPLFFRWDNFLSILLNASIIGIFASGLTMVIISGGIDLSTAATAAVGVMVMGWLYQMGISPWIGSLAGLAAGALCGLVNGILIAKVGLAPMIVTIANQMVFRALAYAFTDVKTIMIKDSGFYAFGRLYVFGIPISVVYMLIFFAAMYYLLEHTVFGRKIYAVGGNPAASYFNGIDIQKTQIAIYVIMGGISAFAGLVSAAQSAAAAPVTLNGREFDFISPAILGGITMSGGKGKILGTFIGCILLAIVSNGMVLAGLQSYWQTLTKGLILVFAMCIDAARNKQAFV